MSKEHCIPFTNVVEACAESPSDPIRTPKTWTSEASDVKFAADYNDVTPTSDCREQTPVFTENDKNRLQRELHWPTPFKCEQDQEMRDYSSSQHSRRAPLLPMLDDDESNEPEEMEIVHPTLSLRGSNAIVQPKPRRKVLFCSSSHEMRYVNASVLLPTVDEFDDIGETKPDDESLEEVDWMRPPASFIHREVRNGSGGRFLLKMKTTTTPHVLFFNELY